MPKITAIIITYHPDLNALEQLVDRIETQVEKVLIVDNGSGVELQQWFNDQEAKQLQGIFLQENLGIAAAQNIGIDHVIKSGSDYVLLLDQDSEPAANMVSCLHAAINKLTADGHQVAAVGPLFRDVRRDARPFVRLRGLRYERVYCDGPDSLPEVDHLIASGSLIPVNVFSVVGKMMENFFIDYVDIEWSLRADYHGYKSFGVCVAVMKHSLGEDPVSFRGRFYSMHSPLRHYYQIRNAVLMCRLPWVTWARKYTIFRRLLLKYFFYSYYGRPRRVHFRLMSLGIWHGLRGKTGRLLSDSG